MILSVAKGSRREIYESAIALRTTIGFTLTSLERAIEAGSVRWVDSPVRADDIMSSIRKLPTTDRRAIEHKLARIESRLLARADRKSVV